MVAFHSARKHSESDLKAAIAWCIRHRKSPAHWCFQLKQLRNAQLRKEGRLSKLSRRFK